eukprot:3276429-Amphidinium_carterae.1
MAMVRYLDSTDTASEERRDRNVQRAHCNMLASKDCHPTMRAPISGGRGWFCFGFVAPSSSNFV